MFPTITHINDVLPHIAGKDEFIVVNKGFYTVIDYVYAKDNTFDNDYARECRGIKFCSTTGGLLARPYHKFFNLGERVGFREEDLDFTRPHVLLDKLDGSMVHPILVKEASDISLCTRMGVTEHAVKAETLLSKNEREWLKNCLLTGFTPILEWIAPDNQIVLKYEKPELVLTGIRRNITGHYVPLTDSMFDFAPFAVVEGNGFDLDSVKESEGIEGIIVRFDNGEMIKVKSDWYVARHKVKSHFENEENILTLVLNNQLDDVLPLLDENDLKRLLNYNAAVWAALTAEFNGIRGSAAVKKAEVGTRKDFAAWVNARVRAVYRPLYFAAYDNKFDMEHLKKHVLKVFGKPDWRLLIGNVEW